MDLDRIDHVVFTVRDLSATCDFTFGDGRLALRCGGIPMVIWSRSPGTLTLRTKASGRDTSRRQICVKFGRP